MTAFSSPLGVEAERQDRAPTPTLNIGPGSFFVSEVSDSIAWFGTVKVNAVTSGTIQGVPLWESSGAVGARRIGAAYPVHTKVICYQPDGAEFCYILGAVPDWVTSGNYNFVPAWVVMASMSGFGFDRVHHGALERPEGKTPDINFSAGRPCDELPGDSGYINDFGLSYGLGRAMAWLRASYFCGVEAHWIDNLLRLVGFNYELMTSGSELRAFNDEGEWSEINRWGHLPWETTGVMGSGEDFTRQGSGEWLSGEAGREPKEVDQAGIWRVQRFRGFLGDLERTIVSLPDPTKFVEGPETMSGSVVLPGLLDVGFDVNGEYRVRSAKGILLEKSVAIPVPKEVIAPDDATGDNPENYKAAGVFGEGADHVKEEPTLEDDQPGLRSMMAYERHALLINLYSNLSFVRHEKDWRLPEESEALMELGLESGVYRTTDGIEVDDSAFWMPLPASVDKQIDHRGGTRYYAGRAMIRIDEDGSVLVEDAYGSQVRLEGGNAFVEARNDVVMKSGRNIQLWAPNDLIFKAGNSVDLSASHGDVRVKAEGNLMMVANTKGVLIEAKDDGGTPDWNQFGEDIDSKGVLIKALDSSVISMSKDTYIRSGAAEGTERVGALHIDAGAGDGQAFVHGRNVLMRCFEKAEIIVGSTGESDNTASVEISQTDFLVGGRTLQNVNFGASQFRFGHEDFASQINVLGELYCNGRIWTTNEAFFGGAIWGNSNLFIQGNMQMDGNAIFTGTVIAASLASDNSSGFLPSTGDDFNAADNPPPTHPTAAEEALDAAQETLRNALRAARDDDNFVVSALQEELYGEESRFASSDLINAAVFSFRTPEQYDTVEGFVWFESRWQELNRKVLGKSEVWDEVAIQAPTDARNTMPYPGYEIWEEENALVTLDDRLFDFGTGTSISRKTQENGGASGIEDEELGERVPKKFKSAYIVTLQKGKKGAQDAEV